jgi:tetratricopeptide (TPR) repeat protein
MPDWEELHARARERYEDGEARLPDDPDQRQRQLTRMGNAATAAALTAMMAGGDGGEWFARSAERYRESWEHAPPGSWGRPIGAVKSLVLAGDWAGAEEAARWALDAGAAASESPIGRYAAALALLVLGDDEHARVQADAIRTREDFPADVAAALAYLAAQDVVGYAEAAAAVLESFEAREDYLEDMPVADTVLVLQALARRRRIGVELSSPLLP